ncbi:MAG: hypothetical protein RID91_11155 [Azospirillaceae bacterium]
MMPKSERVAEFLRRLGDAPPASSHGEAFDLLADTLNRVEDEFTDVPFDPTRYLSDGRLYPPQADSSRSVDGRPDLTRYRSRGHNTWIGENGAIHVRTLNGTVLLDKPGAGGKTAELV